MLFEKKWIKHLLFDPAVSISDKYTQDVEMKRVIHSIHADLDYIDQIDLSTLSC